MGLWREVFLTVSGPVGLRYPTVISHVDAAGNAQLTVMLPLKHLLALKQAAQHRHRIRFTQSAQSLNRL